MLIPNICLRVHKFRSWKKNLERCRFWYVLFVFDLQFRQGKIGKHKQKLPAGDLKNLMSSFGNMGGVKNFLTNSDSWGGGCAPYYRKATSFVNVPQFSTVFRTNFRYHRLYLEWAGLCQGKWCVTVTPLRSRAVNLVGSRDISKWAYKQGHNIRGVTGQLSLLQTNFACP